MLELSSINVKERYERKFSISELAVGNVESIIKINPAMFSEIFYERIVNNLYFDFMGMENYKDHIDGNSKRLKVRIRWYGNLFGLVKNPWLELKMKINELGKKIRFPLRDFVLDKNLSREFLQKEVFAKSNLPEWVMEILKASKLSLLNCYKRKYFRSSDKIHRITLDHDLIFFEIKDICNSFKHKIKDNRVILEVKYDRKNDDKTSKITQHLPFRMTKSSKYVSGISLLHQ